MQALQVLSLSIHKAKGKKLIDKVSCCVFQKEFIRVCDSDSGMIPFQIEQHLSQNNIESQTC